MVQEVKSLTRSHWTKIKVLEGLCSFLELLEENKFPSFSCFRRLSTFLDLWAPFTFKASNGPSKPFSYHIILTLLVPSAAFTDPVITLAPPV